MVTARICAAVSCAVCVIAATCFFATQRAAGQAPAPAGAKPEPAKKTYVYKTAGTVKIQADVYRVADQQRRPVVVYIHGGALISGSRADLVQNIGLAELCKNEGYILISPDYRLAPEAKLPQIIEDLRDFMKWVREKGPELFGADASRIVVVGQSAGGYLALMTGLDPVPPKAIVSCWGYGDVDGDWYTKPSEFYRKQPLVTKEDIVGALSATVLTGTGPRSDAPKGAHARVYLYYRQNGLWTREVSGFDPATQKKQLDPYCPVRNVTDKYPPTVLIHGEADTDVPCQESLDMAAQLKQKGVRHELITVPRAGHMLMGGDGKLNAAAFARAREFIKEALGAAPAVAAASQPAVSADLAKVWPFDAKAAAKKQADAAKALGVDKDISLSLADKVAIKLTLIPPGKFLMGSSQKEQDAAIAMAAQSKAWEYPVPVNEGPQHEVELTKPFYMAICPVTKAQFAAFAADSGYKTAAENGGEVYAWTGKGLGRVAGASWQKPGFDQADDHPAVLITHQDAQAFCDWLSKKTSRTVALPTEAQWEWACRAGAATAFFWGDKPDDAGFYCNPADLSQTSPMKDGRFAWKDAYPFTSPVGKFKPNAFGLFDMEGNVKQWCSDFYDGKYYAVSEAVDPAGPKTGSGYACRGSGWSGGPSFCRSAVRGMYSGNRCDATHGFRIIVTDVDKK